MIFLSSQAGAAITANPRRCYSSSPISGPNAVIDGAEAHHLLHVLRVSPGDPLVVFDGSGREFQAEVIVCQRTSVELSLGAVVEVDRELSHPVTVGCPLPKGDRARWIVEKAVELGVTTIAPLETTRTERRSIDAKTIDKLRRYVIEASKQCGRNRLLEIATPLSWSEWLALPGGQPVARRWIADQTGQRRDHVVGSNQTSAAFIGVGPEGGLTASEIEQATAAGWQLISLGPRTLRIETAVIAAVLAATT